MTKIKSKILKQGATIGLVSPASPLAGLVPHRFERGVKYLHSAGFKVVVGKHATNVCGYHSGSIAERVEDLHSMFKNPNIDAIICCIGGYHYNQLLQSLDFDLIKKNPKIFMGYSDATVLHMAFWSKLKMVSFYGPALLTQFAENPEPLPYTIEYFKKAVMDQNPIGPVLPASHWTEEILNWFTKSDLERARKLQSNNGYKTIRGGKAKGLLLGGCVSSLLHLRGTSFWPDFKDAILFLETPEGSDFTKGEGASMVEMHLTDLKLSGVFEQISGIILGRFFGTSLDDQKIITTKLLDLTAKNPVPILADMDFGHTDPIITIPIGCLAELDADQMLLNILESGLREN